MRAEEHGAGDAGSWKRTPSHAHRPRNSGGTFVSIVRVGLAETKKFAEGYEVIFGKQAAESEETAEKAPAKDKAKTAAGAKAQKKAPAAKKAPCKKK